MDAIVAQAMAKWPHVPHCYGWLALDARGHWHLRDDSAQRAGAFASGAPGSQGDLLHHEKLIGFIHRNYSHDAHGQWYFQNGPQRVYVELATAPWVWRIQADGRVEGQTGQSTDYRAGLVDEQGWFYLDTPLGLGLVHTLDMGLAAQAIDEGHWSAEPVLRASLPARFQFVLSPQQRQRELLPKE